MNKFFGKLWWLNFFFLIWFEVSHQTSLKVTEDSYARTCVSLPYPVSFDGKRVNINKIYIRSDKICIGTNPHFRFCRRKIIIINFKIFLCLKQLLFQLWWILIKWWPWAKAVISLNIVYRSVIISLIIPKAYII